MCPVRPVTYVSRPDNRVPGAARGIRTPDPIITKRGIGASLAYKAVHSDTRECAVVKRRTSALTTSPDVLR